MISSSTLKHLRFPFSFFLMPVYLFALSNAEEINVFQTLLSFALIHIFLYPASNGYNSYFDKDEDSIGGLKNPPPVKKDLYRASIFLDVAAILLGFLIQYQFAIMLLIYGLVSKAYSHPSIRLKKFPITGWLVIGLFQGFFTFIMSWMAISDQWLPAVLSNEKILIAAGLSSLLLWGSYPMTQIYQHEEDSRRGDQTISLKLGLMGTFHFTAIFFTVAMAGFSIFYLEHYDWTQVLLFLSFLSPVLVFFLSWYLASLKDREKINFENTMRLNMISSVCLNIAFLLFFYLQ